MINLYCRPKLGHALLAGLLAISVHLLSRRHLGVLGLQ
jgi:hypothetical protein